MGGGPRALPALLAAATLLPIGALGWLGVRVLEQDRALDRQRSRERLEFAAGRVAFALEGRLSEVEEQLGSGTGMRFSTAGIDSGVLYQPVGPGAPPPSFDAAEEAEFARRDLPGAAAAYRALAGSPNPQVRAGALARLGRVLRKSGDRQAALSAYDALQRLGGTLVGDQPAELLARQARCRMAEEAGDSSAVGREAGEFATAFYRGGWRIDRATFEVYRDILARWGAPSAPDTAIARTEAAIGLWRQWRSGVLPPRGRRVMRQNGEPLLAIWHGHAVWLGTPRDVRHLAHVAPEYDLWLLDAAGESFVGAASAGGVTLHPAETRLPFLLGLSRHTPDSHLQTGRVALIGGLTLTCAFTLAAAYGLYRVTTREMALARQQADFVSAVSHEFRTPLTSMRHLTELLAAGHVPTEQRKAYYYELLANETERLHRMVESLLSFGRMEAGAYPWRLETADPRELVGGILEEFRNEPQFRDRETVCDIAPGLPPIRADREALSRAVWNLLENASKYSAPRTPIHVFARRAGDAVEVGVEDQGIGIPKAEQVRIFQKFVRGDAAQKGGIGGVGIGLALVQRIMEAHGGSVQVTSEPGRGSTFTLVFPCHAS
jgi:signal transduction histidine kinase